MPKCPRHSRKVSKTRCFDKNDNVVTRRPGRCPKGSRKTSTRRCFNQDDHEVLRPGQRPIYKTSRYMLNNIQEYLGTATMKGFVRPNELTANLHFQYKPDSPEFVDSLMYDYFRFGRRHPDEYYQGRNDLYLAEFQEYFNTFYRQHGLKPRALTQREKRAFSMERRAFMVEYSP